MSANQNPEQIARDAIDAQLRVAGWAVQPRDGINFHECEGQAVREYTTDSGPADYMLFVDGKPVGVIEAKKETLGHKITAVEDQTADYASSKLKYIQSTGVPLPFLYEATGVITRFTDQRDPKPRSREVFLFHRAETLRAWLASPAPDQSARSLRARLHDLRALDPIKDLAMEVVMGAIDADTVSPLADHLARSTSIAARRFGKSPTQVDNHECQHRLAA